MSDPDKLKFWQQTLYIMSKPTSPYYYINGRRKYYNTTFGEKLNTEEFNTMFEVIKSRYAEKWRFLLTKENEDILFPPIFASTLLKDELQEKGQFFR